jgi:hypothetical protein
MRSYSMFNRVVLKLLQHSLSMIDHWSFRVFSKVLDGEKGTILPLTTLPYSNCWFPLLVNCKCLENIGVIKEGKR